MSKDPRRRGSSDDETDPLSALKRLPLEAIKPLRELIRTYENWIVHNAEYVGYLESTLRALLFILPRKYPESQIETEAAYSGVSLLSLYHDLVIIKFFSKHPQHSRTIQQRIPQSTGRFRVAAVLTALSNSELFLELLAARFWQTKGRWTLCICVETLKALLRFWVLTQNGGRILIQQTLPARDTFLAANSDPNNTSLNNRPPLRQSQSNPIKLAGEILYVVRPLIYLTALVSRGRRSWFPWLLSLSVDVTSRALISSSSDLTSSERDELARRTVQWCYYFLRSPFFEYVINSEWFTSLTNSQPIASIKSLFAAIAQYILTYRRHYFYTAGSS